MLDDDFLNNRCLRTDRSFGRRVPGAIHPAGQHRDAPQTFESLLLAVTLAVGLTPEFLPLITTVTLSMGALRMARSRVIVKHLDAIENFGSIDVLCSDKTGTIVEGRKAFGNILK